MHSVLRARLGRRMRSLFGPPIDFGAQMFAAAGEVIEEKIKGMLEVQSVEKKSWMVV